jgi:hypothetical protein
MTPSPNTATRYVATLLILLQVQVFVGILITAGYSLGTTLTAASAVAVITAEVTARLLGGDGPGSATPPQLPTGSSG